MPTWTGRIWANHERGGLVSDADSSAEVPAGRRHADPPHPLVTVLVNRSLRRALLAFFVFDCAEWSTWIAILVWAYQSGGPGAAGLIAVVQLVPATVAAPFTAVLGDRMRRDRALSLGYLVQAATMVATGVALALDAPSPLVYLAAAASATAVVMTRPVHHALVPEIAETPQELTAGNAATSTVEGAGALVGPLLAGAVIAWQGAGAVYLIMGVLSLGSALITRRLDLRRTFRVEGSAESAVAATVMGTRQLWRDRGALLLTIVVAAQFVLLGLMDILTVVLGIDVLGLGPSSPGLLVSAAGIGALLGAAATVVLVGRRRLSPAILAGMLITGLPLVLVAGVSLPIVAGALLAVYGFGKPFVDVAGRTLLQRTVPADVLSRIFGVQESLIMGGTALGSALAPLLVHVFGARGAFVATGLLLPSVGLAFWLRIRRLDDEALLPGPAFGLLQLVPVFAVLPQATLERLSREMVEQQYATGDQVIRQGDTGDRFYLVASGTVEIVRDGTVVTTTGRGGYFGEIALLRDVPRTAMVRASEPVVVFALDREQFLEAVTGTADAHEIADGEASRRMEELGG
jgi:MFS family permease